MTYHVIEANYSDFSQDHTQKNCLIFMFMLVVCDAIYPIQKNQLEKPTVKLFLPLFSHGISSSFFLAPGISAKKMAGSVWLLWRKQISRDFAVATFSVPHRGDWVFLVQTFVVLFWYDATHDVATLQLEHWYIWRRNWFTLFGKKADLWKVHFCQNRLSHCSCETCCCLDHPIYGNTEAVLNAVPSARCRKTADGVGANNTLFLRREKELGRRGCSWQNRCAAEIVFRFIDIYIYEIVYRFIWYTSPTQEMDVTKGRSHVPFHLFGWFSGFSH